ncbi:MAG: glycosyltransferase [Candidatus Rokubacteria bacterium]|nr:glycosyltransferase [Candidatus Rokubacteria bacterium]
MSLRVAMLSVHTCPLAALGGKETGGMNVYVRELSRELGRMGLAVDVFTRSQDPTIRRVVPLGEGARVIHLAAGPEAPMAREAVHDHLDEFVEGVDAWRIARRVEYDLIHAHYWLSGVVGLALRERWGVPVLQMFHTLGRFKNGAARRRADLEPSLRLEEERRVVGGVDGLVAASIVERRALVDVYGAAPAHASVIPCGVDTALFRPGDRDEARARLGAGAAPLVLYVGRIAPIKGLETLLDAFVRLRARRGPGARLFIVGGEADEPADGHEADIRRRVDALGLRDAVRFVGAQPQDALRDFYVGADVTVLPSYYESFGMVALEAMACGSPVIGSRVGGLATTVRDGVTGFLVADGDAEALAERLDTVVGDADLRFRLGREGVQWAARHRWPCVAEAICREYARLEARAAPHLAAGRCQE